MCYARVFVKIQPVDYFTTGVVRQGPRVPLGELQRSNTPIEKVYR